MDTADKQTRTNELKQSIENPQTSEDAARSFVIRMHYEIPWAHRIAAHGVDLDVMNFKLLLQSPQRVIDIRKEIEWIRGKTVLQLCGGSEENIDAVVENGGLPIASQLAAVYGAHVTNVDIGKPVEEDKELYSHLQLDVVELLLDSSNEMASLLGSVELLMLTGAIYYKNPSRKFLESWIANVHSPLLNEKELDELYVLLQNINGQEFFFGEQHPQILLNYKRTLDSMHASLYKFAFTYLKEGGVFNFENQIIGYKAAGCLVTFSLVTMQPQIFSAMEF